MASRKNSQLGKKKSKNTSGIPRGKAGVGARRALAEKNEKARDEKRARYNPGGDLYLESVASGSRPDAFWKKKGAKGRTYVPRDKVAIWNNDRETYLLKESQAQLERDKKVAAQEQRDAQAEREREAAEVRRQAQQDYRDEVVGMQVGAAESENRNRGSGQDSGVGENMEGGDTARADNVRNVTRRRAKEARAAAGAELDEAIAGNSIDPRSRRKSVFDKNRRQLLGQARRDSKAKLGYGRK